MPEARRRRASPRKCELYAVGDTVVYAHGKPPMPPKPWVRHDAVTERPFVAKGLPMVRDPGKARLENMFMTGRKTKAIALGPGGQFFLLTGVDSVDDSVRRALESCGGIAGVACMIVAVDEISSFRSRPSLRVTGFFQAAGNAMIAAEARDDVARQLADAPWAGTRSPSAPPAGRDWALKAATEQAAVNAALADCAKRDSDCHVVAIGPFTVGPN